MTVRITQNEIVRTQILNVLSNRENVDKYANQVSSGLKVVEPGDTNIAGTIAAYQDTLAKVDGYEGRISTAKGFMQFQDDALNQMNELLVRAKEVAVQAGNGTNSDISRAQLAGEIFQIRDNVVQLANLKYQDKYVFHGNDDSNPAYIRGSDYTTPVGGTGEEIQRWVFAQSTGSTQSRTVNITDNLSVTLNQTPSNSIFDNAVGALERLGRSLAGLTTSPATGLPNGTGGVYTFPAQFAQQTADINTCIDLLTASREQDLMPARVTLASQMHRLDTGDALLKLSKTNVQEQLASNQQADISEAASSLATAQNALQASYAVSARVLNLSILDYL